MKQVWVLIFATFVSITPAAYSVAQDKTEKGYVELFDGKTLKGWNIMNKGKFFVKDGAIYINGGRGWLRSDKEYSDFILKLELRFLKNNQDSGIFLRATKEGRNWPQRRYEVQCHNNKSMARIFGASHKVNKELVSKVLRKPDEWNTYEIKCVGENLEVKLNGELVTTAKGLKRDKGYIGLQGEGGQLEFRNVRIKEMRK